ncbi:MAG: 4-hydroxy-tetrahydrodipicolinate reductase [Bacteroidia bacterium]|nr:4-hydroxy-tetrahydrodipicolinate reductase [Bacteroidia bacterium]
MTQQKLNIGLIGYGKMGKTIEQLALNKGHHIVLKTSRTNPIEKNLDKLESLDVAIEFTAPGTAAKNLEVLSNNKVPTVCGSTAWLEKYEWVCANFEKNNTPFLYASNFSIGVNVFFSLNQHLARLMNLIPGYEISLFESHHIEKKDAPSGTAVSLADQIMKDVDRKSSWSLEDTGDMSTLHIEAHREGDVKGLHEIKYTSGVDQIVIKHEAFNREGFASGALLAAEWIQGKTGIYSMKDVLSL